MEALAEPASVPTLDLLALCRSEHDACDHVAHAAGGDDEEQIDDRMFEDDPANDIIRFLEKIMEEDMEEEGRTGIADMLADERFADQVCVCVCVCFIYWFAIPLPSHPAHP